MKNLKYIALAAVAALTTAYNNDEMYDVQPEGTFRVNVEAVCPNTRTTIANDNSLSWSESDVMGVYVDNIQSNRPFNRSNSGGFIGSFAYTGKAASTTTFRAYYPYSEYNNGFTITALLPSEQSAEFDGAADFMISDPLTAAYTEDKEMTGLKFNFSADSHLFTVVRLTLKDGAQKALATENVSSVRISSPGNTLSGTFSVDMRDAANRVNFTVPKDYVNLTFKKARPSLSSPVTVYAVVRPTDENKPITLTVDVMTSGGKAQFTSGEIELKRSTVKELPQIVVSDTWKKSESVNESFTDKRLLEFLIKNYDSNDDKLLTRGELSAVTELSFPGINVSSLAGIEMFDNLVSLDCSNNNITVLNLETCTKLTSLNISGNAFTSINLSKNATLQTLTAQSVNVTKLDLSGCRDLNTADFSNANIGTLILDGLTKLPSFTTGRISHLSAKNNKGLNSLSIINIGLKSLDLTGCTGLLSLDCYDNAELTEMKLTGCKALSSIMCRSCAFTSLDLSGLSSLTTIYCQRGQLQSINLKGCVALNNFYAHTNKWIEIDLTECVSIGSINVKDSPTIKKIILPEGKNSSIVNHEGSSPEIVIAK
ncbi:MAG: fimbrillin family protein [Rikenellaceae bacterium]|nr:fimbrillin family protein [Rikenellaceae bacterium]